MLKTKNMFLNFCFLFVLLITMVVVSGCEDKEYKLVYYTLTDENIDMELVNRNEIENYQLKEPQKEGYAFLGWYLDKEYVNKWDSKKISDSDGVLELYAKWKKNTYNLKINYGQDDFINKEIGFGEKIEIENPQKNGWYFAGWFIDNSYQQEFDYVNMPANDLEVYAKWNITPTYSVVIKSNLDGAFNFDGDINQTVALNDSFENVEIITKLGYKFNYYEINGVKYASNVVSLNNVTENTEIIVYGEYATYELPIVSIDTNNSSINSKVNYTDMIFSMSNCEDELENVPGGIRLRGNSTMGYDKKPYRIKFDKKQSLFGLDKAKSWVLLADYLDPSGLHNYTAFKLASELDGLHFTPTPNKVNVYLNGNFVGLYTLCEQVQENEGRMDIEVDITEEMTDLKDFNFFISMDYNAANDVEAVLDETYFYIEEYDRYFELKYPEKDQFVTEEQFDKFFGELKQYTKDLMDIFYDKDVAKIKQEVNVNSLVDYLIIDQIMGERDHSYKSFNMYYTSTSSNEEENEKINFGPIWDYDWSLYTEWTGKPNDKYTVSNEISYSNIFFKTVANTPELYELVKERYSEDMSEILEDFISNLYSVEQKIGDSLYLNHVKWYGAYDDDLTNKNIEFLNKYLLNRKLLLDELWCND